MSKLSFPAGFVWGAATSSYQIEGATQADGRGQSNWDVFSHTPGNILNGDTGDVACDHYNRWREDIQLMRSIGLKSYRFSIAWSRVFPEGDGKVNQKGLDFYSRLIDGLLEAGITPLVALYHWDYPWALENEGAWRERPIVDKFARYTDVVSRAYGDRAQRWVTHNEPAVASFVAHWNGVHSPGKKDFGTALRVAHHLLLSHGAAVPIIRANVPDAQVGIVIDVNHTVPLSDSDRGLRTLPLRRRLSPPPVPRPRFRPWLSARRDQPGTQRGLYQNARPGRRDQGRRYGKDRRPERLPRDELLPA